ncbi:hypothetical protein Q3G72_014683 [Acer saccharum]|nr:hypothetical protein Q3G72_014683 [Acer saccharum]
MKRCGNNTNSTAAHQFSASLSSFVRRSSFRFLSVVPIPNHVAFIMDGNRSYSTKKKLEEGAGHKDGFVSLMYVLNNCYELGIKLLEEESVRCEPVWC